MSLRIIRAAKAAIKAAPKLSGSYFNLLTPGNPKTLKGNKKGYWTFILHLSPADASGFEVCPKRTAGCTEACLNLSGRGGIFKKNETTNSIQIARKRRTVYYFENRAAFMADLVADITKACAFARKHNYIPVFRLNGTSDIRWELASHNGRRLIADLFRDVQFYDYTKLPNCRNLPANYHLTFSYADGNATDVTKAVANGLNVAVVFRNKERVAHYVAEGFLGLPVFVGDESDLRFTDPKGVCALYAKGSRGRKDTSGFVVD